MKAKTLLLTVLTLSTTSVFAYSIGFNEEGQFGAFDENGNKMTLSQTLKAQGNLILRNFIPQNSQANSKTTPNTLVLPSLSPDVLLPRLFSNIQVNQKFRSTVTKYPFIAVQQQIDGEKQLHFLQQHPTLTYQNVQNQTRYFVFIESMPVIGSDVNECHGCYVKGYLLNFKKLANGSFELTNKNPSLVDIPSSYGQSQMKISDIKTQLKSVGQNTKGALFKTGFTSGGVTETYFHLLALQDERVRILTVGDAGVSGQRYSEVKDDLINFDYTGKAQVLSNIPNAQLYPIQVTYSGTSFDFKRVNYKQTYKFNATSGEYQ